MIVDIILLLVLVPTKLVVALLSAILITLPIGVSQSIATVIFQAYKFNEFFPMDTLMLVLGLALTVEAGLLSLKIVLFFWAFIRGYKSHNK